MDYSIKADAAVIKVWNSGDQKIYRSHLASLPTQKRLTYCLLFDELAPKFLGKTSIKGLLL
jgi:hypothetical protein